MDDMRTAIERNIKRNQGVFAVPRYLFQGDPHDKYGSDCRANVMLRARRDGLSTSQPTGWWRQTIQQEQRGAHAGFTTNTSAPASAPAPAPPLPTAAAAAASVGGQWAYYAAGVTPKGPGGAPALVYLPCWMPTPPAR